MRIHFSLNTKSVNRTNVRFQFISSLEITALGLHNDVSQTIYYSKNKNQILAVMCLSWAINLSNEQGKPTRRTTMKRYPLWIHNSACRTWEEWNHHCIMICPECDSNTQIACSLVLVNSSASCALQNRNGQIFECPRIVSIHMVMIVF